MLDVLTEITNKDNENDSAPSAFIFYIPPTSSANELVFYNEEAWSILSAHEPNSPDNKISLGKITSICSNWQAQIDKDFLINIDVNPDISSGAFYIDIIHSYRRRYAVKAVVLLKPCLEKQEKNYLFMLERFIPENLNLLKIIREYRLSRREQEILHLLIKGFSNKEIAYELNLSLNTIKTYMKQLMGKFNVTNRSSIIADLLKKGV